MTAVVLLVTLALSILSVPLAAAPPAGKVHRIGVLGAGPAPSEAERQRSPFLRELHQLGYVEGQNIIIERRYAEGNLDRLPDLAAELVRLPVDILLAAGTAALSAKQATTTIPIVFFATPNPVARGLVASLARPGGNITGVSFDVGGPGLTAKRLELLKEAVPTVSRVAILWGQERSPASYFDALEKELESTARVLGLTLRFLYVRRPEEFLEWVFPAIKADMHAINALYAGSPGSFGYRQQLADFALQNRLPMMGVVREQAEAGVLLAYGPTQREMLQRAAVLVDKILQGATPADLPVEQPMKFELVINLKTAKALGLTMPASLLFQADEVIQ